MLERLKELENIYEIDAWYCKKENFLYKILRMNNQRFTLFVTFVAKDLKVKYPILFDKIMRKHKHKCYLLWIFLNSFNATFLISV